MPKLKILFLKNFFDTLTLGKMSQQIERHILKKYSINKKLGSGAYGHVWKVTDRKTYQVLALKKIFDAFQHSTDAQRTYREIVFLHQIDHPNIIKLHNVIKADNQKDLYLIFQFMESDLHNAIGQKILKDVHNKFIIYQIVKGIKFLHSAQLLHRDLKPSNILLNSDCNVKICDFGLARSLAADREGTDLVLTEEVATRWYRAPEVLLGSHKYNYAADIWSIGCIFGEMLMGKPMFSGSSTLDQLQRILKFTGRPTKEDIYSLNSELAISMISSINDIKIRSLPEWLQHEIPGDAINLLIRMLQFNPKKRPTASQILNHSYLADFHDPREEIVSHNIIFPPISDNKKLSLKYYRQLIYDRIRKFYKSPEKQVFKKSNGSFLRPDVDIKSFSAHKEQNYRQFGYGTPVRNSSGKGKNINYSVSHHDKDEKISKKNSLKQILKNKRSKDENHKISSPTISGNNYAQKYYRKSGMSTAIYKENKIGRYLQK